MSYEDMDDWLFQSVRLYDDLHMYELQHASQTLEWLADENLMIASQLDDGSSEIVQLALPAALTASAKKNGIRKESDFKVLSSCIHNKKITCLRHLPESRLLIAAEGGKNCVTLWNLPKQTDDTGLIRNCGILQNPESTDCSSSAAVVDAREEMVTFGSHTSNLSLADVINEKIIFTALDCDLYRKQRISIVKFLNKFTLLSCESLSGRIDIIDTRINPGSSSQLSSASKAINPSPDSSTKERNSQISNGVTVGQGAMNGDFWTCDLLSESNDTSRTVLKLCSNGMISLCDTRRMDSDVATARLLCKMFNRRHQAYLTVKFITSERFSVSGFDGNVYVYDLPSSGDNFHSYLTPIFVHTGHQAAPAAPDDDVIMVWTHGCHPCRADTVLSCASDGSLHAWQYNEKNYSAFCAKS